MTFDFRTTRTFVHYKFSPLIRLSYAEFALSYAADEQTFRAIVQWRSETSTELNFESTKYKKSRSQWPRGLRRGSATPRLLGLWVRIPPGIWIAVCCECCVLSGRGLCDGPITRPEKSYRVWCV